MSILVVTAWKTNADSKLGFTYSTTDGSTTITSVVDSGLFGGTSLKVGQSVLTINGSCAGGGAAEMKTLLASLGSGEVTIVVEKPTDDMNKAIFVITAAHDKNKGRIQSRGRMTSEGCPQVLVDAGVPHEKWLCVRSLIIGKLMPASLKFAEADLGKSGTVLADNAGAVMSKVVRTNKNIKVAHSATIVAVSVRDQVNTILGKYGVMAVLEYTEDSVTNNAVNATGFSFHRMG